MSNPYLATEITFRIYIYPSSCPGIRRSSVDSTFCRNLHSLARRKEEHIAINSQWTAEAGRTSLSQLAMLRSAAAWEDKQSMLRSAAAWEDKQSNLQLTRSSTRLKLKLQRRFLLSGLWGIEKKQPCAPDSKSPGPWSPSNICTQQACWSHRNGQ